MRKLYKIGLIAVGAFVAYNLIVIWYAFSQKLKGQRLYYIKTYAPWLLISQSFTNWVMS
jgi:hypothetical protein